MASWGHGSAETWSGAAACVGVLDDLSLGRAGEPGSLGGQRSIVRSSRTSEIWTRSSVTSAIPPDGRRAPRGGALHPDLRAASHPGDRGQRRRHAVRARSVLTGSGAVEAVVVASSGGGLRARDEAHDEEAALGPTDITGYSKEWTERLAAYLHESTDISVGIARNLQRRRPGETNPHLLPAIIEQARETESSSSET